MSEKLKDLLSDIVIENDFNSPSLVALLKACEEYQNFTRKDTSTIISQINSNLSANVNTEQNLLLLKTVIQQSSEDVLVSNAISWMSFCIKYNDSFCESIQNIGYTNLYLLLAKSQQSNDVKKAFVVSVLPKFILKLDSASGTSCVCLAKLKCLEKVLKYYNGPCFSHYKSIERFLLQCMDAWHSQDTILFHTGLCFALLSQLGGGGHQTSMYRDNWAASLCKLVKYAHEVLDSVFEDVPEIQTVPIPDSVRTLEVSIPFPSYYPNTRDSSKLHSSPHLLRAFKVLSILLRTHLAAPFPAPKMINLEAVLSVVARTLSVTPSVLSNLDATSGHAITLSLLPGLHTHAHALLNTLINVAGRNLIPHSLYICKLTIHTLKWTNTEEAGRYALERPFRVLRCAAYKTLHTWLALADYSSNVELMAEELTGYLLADITYEKPPVTLTAVTKKTRKKHKTKVGLEAEKRPVADYGGNAELRERSGGAHVAAWAHRVLADMLRASALMLKPDLLKNIQTHIAGLMLNLCTGCTLAPYSSCTDSRHALYSSVESLLLHAHPMTPDMSHYATVFFHAGLNDSQLEIRQVCRRGIELLEKMHHPKADSLNFVMENLEDEKLKLVELEEKNAGVVETNVEVNGDVSSSGEDEKDKKTNKRKRKKEEDRGDRKKLKGNKASEVSKTTNKDKKRSNTQLAVFDGKKERKESFIELADSSESDASEDSGTSGYEDSDDMAMMMNIMANGEDMSSEFDSDDDDTDDDDEEDTDDDDSSSMDEDFSDSDDVGFMGGFTMGASLLNTDSSESDSSESDGREGVVITEIVEETVAVANDIGEVDEGNQNALDAKSGGEKDKCESLGKRNKHTEEDEVIESVDKRDATSKPGAREAKEDVSEIEMIELDESSSDDVRASESKHTTEVVDERSEEITLSSDSQEEDVVEIESGMKREEKNEDRDESEDEEAAEEIDDCLKLFNAE